MYSFEYIERMLVDFQWIELSDFASEGDVKKDTLFSGTLCNPP